MENRSHALIAGVFTLFFLAAGVLALWWLGGTHETLRSYLLTTRGNVAGLNVEGQVRYRGIRAGKVKSIRPDPQDPATLLVEIGLQHRYVLTDKTVAYLNYQGVTGIAYVMLEEEGMGGHPLLPEGEVLPRIEIRSGLYQRLGERAEGISREVGELAVRLNQAFDERNLRNVRRALDNLAAASESLKELPEIMAGLRTLLAADNVGRIEALLAQLERAGAATAPLVEETRALVASLAAASRQLETAARQAGAAGGRLAAETLPHLDALLRDVRGSTHRLDRLIEQLDEAPQALVFGKAAARPGPGEAGFVPPARRE